MKLTEKGKLTKSGWLSIVAFLLVAVIALSVALGLVVKSNKSAEKVGSVGGGMVVTEGAEENGVKLTSAQIPVAEFGDYGIMPIAESAWTVTATASSESSALPEDQQKFKWSMAWASTNSADVSTYVTMSESGGKTATFSCLKAFSTQITVTCAWLYDEDVKSTLSLDYAKRLSGLKVSYAKSLTDSASAAYLTETTATAGGCNFTLHVPNQTTVGKTTGAGNWSSKILEFGSDETETWGIGTVENSIRNISVELYTSATSGTSLQANFVRSDDPNSLILRSNVCQVGTWDLFKSFFKSSSSYANFIGSSVSNPPSDADSLNIFYLNTCDEHAGFVLHITLTVTLQYGEPVEIPLTIKLESEPLTADSITFSPSNGHVF